MLHDEIHTEHPRSAVAEPLAENIASEIEAGGLQIGTTEPGVGDDCDRFGAHLTHFGVEC